MSSLGTNKRSQNCTDDQICDSLTARGKSGWFIGGEMGR